MDPDSIPGEEVLEQKFLSTYAQLDDQENLRCTHQYLMDENRIKYCRKCGFQSTSVLIQTTQQLSEQSFSQLDLTINSQIDSRNRDTAGKLLDAKFRRKFAQMRLWQRKFNSATPFRRNLYALEQELSRVILAMNLPSRLKSMAADYYGKVSRENIIRGHNLSAIAAAILCIIVIKKGLGYTLEQFAAQSLVDKKKVAKAYKVITLGMGQHLLLPLASSYVLRFIYYLNLDEVRLNKVRSDVLALLKQKPELDDARNPAALAAALIIINCTQKGYPVHLTQFSKNISISAVTLKAKIAALKAI